MCSVKQDPLELALRKSALAVLLRIDEHVNHLRTLGERRSIARPEILRFWQVPRCWLCRWSVKHTLRLQSTSLCWTSPTWIRGCLLRARLGLGGPGSQYGHPSSKPCQGLVLGSPGKMAVYEAWVEVLLPKGFNWSFPFSWQRTLICDWLLLMVKAPDGGQGFRWNSSGTKRCFLYVQFMMLPINLQSSAPSCLGLSAIDLWFAWLPTGDEKTSC